MSTQIPEDTNDNTRHIAEAIFTRAPGPKNSIDLSIEDPHTSEIARSSGIDNFTNTILSLITFHGIYILFGHKNLLLLTDSQIDLIKEYTKSYGYELKYNVDTILETINIYFEKYY